MSSFLPLSTEETPAPADGGIWDAVLSGLMTVGEKALGIVIIIAGALLASFLLRYVIRRVVRGVVNSAKSKANVDDTQALERSPLADMRLVQRTRTLGTILQNIVNVALVIIAFLLILYVINETLMSSLSLVAAAIAAGLGVGGQNVIKDVLNGLFIVAEDQIGIGDLIDTGLATGIVESVSVRITQVRDVNGTLWHVRNGEILRIGNVSQGWARAIIDLGAPADADVATVEAAMLGAAQGLAKDPKWRTRIVGRPEMWGLESIAGDVIVIRIVIKTRPNAKDDVARELRMRLKKSIEELGLRIPSLASVNPEGLEGAQRVAGANPPVTRPSPVPPTIPAAGRGIWRKKDTGTDSGPVAP